MKKSIMSRAMTTMLCAMVCSISSLHGMASSSAESNFSRQWGAMGTLPQAPTYFKSYVPEKGSCHKKQQVCEASEQIQKDDDDDDLDEDIIE
jgi:hypothetical protein